MRANKNKLKVPHHMGGFSRQDFIKQIMKGQINPTISQTSVHRGQVENWARGRQAAGLPLPDISGAARDSVRARQDYMRGVREKQILRGTPRGA